MDEKNSRGFQPKLSGASKEKKILIPRMNSHFGNQVIKTLKKVDLDFPGHLLVKNLPANSGDMGSVPGLERFHMATGQLSP